MARLWTCGFELQSLTAGVEVSSLTGTASISTSVHRAGAASLRSNPTAGTGFVEHQLTGGVNGRSFYRFYLYVATLPSATATVFAVGQSGYFPVHVQLTTTGTLQLRDSFNSANAGSASAALSTGRWYRIELDVQESGSTGVTREVRGYLDGVDFSGAAMIAGSSGYSRLRAGVQTTATADIYIDDIAVNDPNGSAQTGLPGPGNVVHLRPDSAGDNAGFATTVGGSSNWGRVSEVTPDDGTTYNATTATGTATTDDFNLGSTAAAGISGERVKLVAVGGRIGSDAATAASIVYRIKSQASGTTTESASVSVALNGWATHKAAAPFVPQLTSYTDPQTGGAWTTALLDTAQIGYRSNVSQTTARRVSTLWALVETVPRATAALGTASESGSVQALARAKSQPLGTATESGTAQALTAVLAGTPLAELVDDFDDNTIDEGLWPNSFGDVVEVGGRARVPCTTGYAAYSSALDYRLTGSSIYLRAYAPAGGGATTEAWAQMLIKSTVEGTDLGFELRMTTDELVMFSRSGYFDPDEVDLPYSPTDHAWLRVRESAGTTYWDTSPDGSTWTTQRTETSPAWVGDPDLEFQLIAHRSDGADDYAEFDSVNVPPGGQSADLDPVGETAAAQALAGTKRQALGTAAETGSAQAPGRARSRALTPAGQTAAAQPLGRAKAALLTAAAETGTARPLTGSGATTIGPATESAAARQLDRAKTAPLTAAAASEAAQPLAGRKALALQPASETAAARPAGTAKTAPLTAAAETAEALTLAAAAGLTPAIETSTARPLGRARTRALGTAGEEGEARPLGRAKVAALGGVAETATAQPLTGGRSRALGPAEETCTARPLSRSRARPLPTVTETSSALGLTPVIEGVLTPVGEADTARPVTGRKTRPLPTAGGVEAAQPVAGRKILALGTVGEAAAGRGLVGAKRQALGRALETDRARIGSLARLVPAVEHTTLRPLPGARQRMADHLTATTSGPALATSTGGPALTASTSGPSLTASTTTGG